MARVLFYFVATLLFVSNANAKSGSYIFGDSFLTLSASELDGFSNQNWNHSMNESNASGSVFAEKLNGIGTKNKDQIQKYLGNVYTSYYSKATPIIVCFFIGLVFELKKAKEVVKRPVGIGIAFFTTFLIKPLVSRFC